MMKTTTLSDAISQVFGIKDVPVFTSSKPVKQARAWLDGQGIKYDYIKYGKKNGVFIFTRGAGSPQYAVIGENDEIGAGVQSLASLSPKYKSKSEQRRVEASQAAQIEGDDVESAPVITNSPESEADSETTVVEPKTSTTNRKSRRKK